MHKSPKITGDTIRKAAGNTSNYAKMKSIVDLIQRSEPEFLEWVNASTREEVSHFSDIPLHPQILNDFQSSLLRGKVLAYYIYHIAYVDNWQETSLLSEDVQKRAEAVYEAWLAGELPEQFYLPTKKRSSPAAKARRNFLARKKDRLKIAKRMEEVSEKMNTLSEAGLRPGDYKSIDRIPFVVESGVVETD
jgi:hypothetical protein